MKFCFGIQRQLEIMVSIDKKYTGLNKKQGYSTDYGFLVEENRNQYHQLQIPEINSGFNTVYWYRGLKLTELAEDAHGCYVKGAQADRIPMTFVCEVERQGNYQVAVTLYAEQTIDPVLIFLGNRRLAFIGKIEAGTQYYGTFLTNVCPVIPRGSIEVVDNLTIDLTIIGAGLHLQQVEVTPVDCRTVYIAGDSTVADQSADYPYYSYHSYCGWGQMLSYYVGMEAAVSNHSHSGLTTESFRSEGHYQILLDHIQKGDICLIQFGHNDQKLGHLMAEGGYRERLITYIKELREKDAQPVLVTSLARNTWKGNDGTYNDLLAGYANTCINLAKEYDLPLVDLHQRSMELVKSLGRELVKSYYFPSDYTHSNDYGAYLFAGYVYEALQEQNVLHQKEDSTQELHVSYRWQPPKDLPEIQPPAHLATVADPNAEQLFAHLERPDDDLTRVEALELVIEAMHFFPTNVYNDAFEDVVGHEVYAGTVECACQNGLIPDDMIQNHKFMPNRTITGNEFISIALNGYQSRKGSLTETVPIEQIRKQKSLKRSEAASLLRSLKI